MLTKKLLRITALTLALSIPVFLSAKEKKTYNRSAFSTYRNLPANKTAGNKTRDKISTEFKGWSVTTDKLNGSFTDITGPGITLEGKSTTDKSLSAIQQKLSGLGVKSDEWVKTNEYDAPKASYVNYKQVINQHDVVFASLNFRFAKTGELVRVQMKNYGEPSANLSPKLSTENAKKAAISDITGITVTNAHIDANWSWFPIPKEGGYELHPAWHFKIKAKVEGSVPLILTGYVDAISGEILYRTNDVKETGFDLTVKGTVYKNGTLHPSTLEALPDLWVNNGLSTVFTDTTGYCNSATWLLPITSSIPLAGKWATVIDSVTGNTPTFTNIVSASGTTYTYPTTAPSSNRHVNAYYHVNRVHNFMKGFFPTFTDMDFSLPTNVDLSSGTCNAFYDGTSINFYAADAQCNSFAEIGDIIYHEYGHGISDHFYLTHTPGSSIMNGALNEANSDVWAMSITHNPILGENSFTGYGGFIRRYDNTPQVYPIDWQTSMYADPHYNGEIIAGCWWDVGVNLGNVDSMAKLFTDVYYDVPDGPDGTEGAVYQSILVDALMADDNDANLNNGTPHYSQIVGAFAKHGIYLEGETVLNHTELANQAANVGIPVTASLTVDNPSFIHDLTLNYRINGAGTWTSVALTGTGPYTGTIPAQPQGTTVEYFFTLHDALGTANAYFPITCNPTMINEQTTIPYQFGVGILDVAHNDFEGSVTGWSIGNNAGDDATDGIWQVGTPVASSYYPYLTSFPMADHTTGTGKILMAGSGAGSSGGTVVTAGTTTALTPILDLTTFVNPVIEYFRWYSNEQIQNYKNDPWIVQIRNTANNNWQTVERTYQADLQWRRRIFPVRAYLPSSATHIQLKFAASDSLLSTWNNNGQSITTAGVDDFFIHDIISHVGVNNVAIQRAKVSPNPADNKINITLEDNSNNGRITLYDITGKSIISIAITQGNNSYSLTTDEVSSGIYNLLIQTDKSVQYQKVVITH